MPLHAQPNSSCDLFVDRLLASLRTCATSRSWPVPGGIAGCKTASPQWIDPWISEAFVRRLPCCFTGSKRSKLLGTDGVQKPGCAANQEATPVL